MWFGSCAVVSRLMQRFQTMQKRSYIQECVSEFIGFITNEANEICNSECRRTIMSEDILGSLGFNDYVGPLSVYLGKLHACPRCGTQQFQPAKLCDTQAELHPSAACGCWSSATIHALSTCTDELGITTTQEALPVPLILNLIHQGSVAVVVDELGMNSWYFIIIVGFVIIWWFGYYKWLLKVINTN